MKDIEDIKILCVDIAKTNLHLKWYQKAYKKILIKINGLFTKV